ncbi:hypothetical protein ACOSQ3_032928 [Xanthoceras sorbifolium]
MHFLFPEIHHDCLKWVKFIKGSIIYLVRLTRDNITKADNGDFGKLRDILQIFSSIGCLTQVFCFFNLIRCSTASILYQVASQDKYIWF